MWNKGSKHYNYPFNDLKDFPAECKEEKPSKVSDKKDK